MKVAHNVSIKREVFSFIGDDISYTYAFYIIIAFMLFRAFDILKPFPTNYIDNKIKTLTNQLNDAKLKLSKVQHEKEDSKNKIKIFKISRALDRNSSEL